MRRIMVLGLMLAIAACSWGRKDLGLANVSPDETQVEVRKPLSLPPEFDVRPIVSNNLNED